MEDAKVSGLKVLDTLRQRQQGGKEPRRKAGASLVHFIAVAADNDLVVGRLKDLLLKHAMEQVLVMLPSAAMGRQARDILGLPEISIDSTLKERKDMADLYESGVIMRMALAPYGMITGFSFTPPVVIVHGKAGMNIDGMGYAIKNLQQKALLKGMDCTFYFIGTQYEIEALKQYMKEIDICVGCHRAQKNSHQAAPELAPTVTV